jgi:X-X-X-Leu-X-X-Gly heptad repeat protein
VCSKVLHVGDVHKLDVVAGDGGAHLADITSGTADLTSGSADITSGTADIRSDTADITSTKLIYHQVQRI